MFRSYLVMEDLSLSLGKYMILKAQYGMKMYRR
jgi:hypothetical protein